MNKQVIQYAVIAVLVLITGLLSFLVGQSSTSTPPEDSRTIAYWRAPMDPTEIYNEPGKSKMGMDLVPVYQDEMEGSAQQSKSDNSGKGEIVYWRAPMDPTEIHDGPGKSRMGMDLIPVYENETGGSGGIVTIDPAVVQNMGVKTAPVLREDLSRIIRTVGEVKYDEEKLYLVNSKIGGWIETLYINFIGQEVSKGEPLMEIYSPELVSTQEEYILARKNYEVLSASASESVVADAERLLEAARTRLKYWDIPSDEIARLERTLEVKKTVMVYAPASGIVIERNALEGAFIKPGHDLFRIADLSTVWVHASFYDNEVPWIAEGQSVSMELSYLPGKTYTGKVSYIFPYLREQARDVHVRLIFKNTSDIDLKPGMYANVVLNGRTIKDALTVPTEALIRSGRRTLVFISRGEGKFEPREVREGETGGESSTRVRLLSGILEGEQVVTSAQFLIDSESRLQEAIQKMLSGNANTKSTPDPAGTPAPSEPDNEPVPMEQEMDHSSMDHSSMDSDAAKPEPEIMDHESMNHETMDMPMDSLKVDSTRIKTETMDPHALHRGAQGDSTKT